MDEKQTNERSPHWVSTEKGVSGIEIRQTNERQTPTQQSTKKVTTTPTRQRQMGLY